MKWRDIAYLSDDEIVLKSDGKLEISAKCKDDPLYFAVTFLKTAFEVQRQSNALLPMAEQKSTYSQRVAPNSIPDDEIEEGLDALTYSLTVAVKEDKNILKEV